MKYHILSLLLFFVVCSGVTSAQSSSPSDTIPSPRPLMRDVFASMPDSIAPMVTRNNRLDCIDYIENNMEARVRNILDEYVTLEALTADYARFRTSPSAFLELKLLPLTSSQSPSDTPSNTPSNTSSQRAPSDTASSVPPVSTVMQPYLLCLVRTAQTGEPDTPRRLEDSTIRFFHPDWTSLDSTSHFFTLPPVTAFIASAPTERVEPASPSEEPLSPETMPSALRSIQSFHPVCLSLSADAATLTAVLQPAYLASDERSALSPLLRPLHFRWNGTRFILE